MNHFPFHHLLDDATEYALQSPPAAVQFSQAIFQFTTDVKQLLSTRTIALLPTELLCEIFLFACAFDPHSEAPLDDVTIMRITPMIIGSVCSRWRSIVTTLPTAWSCIDINFHVGIEMQRNKYGMILSKLIQVHLDRSLPQPLSIRVRIPPRASDISVHHSLLMKALVFHFFQCLLIPHCARWRHVAIDVCNRMMSPLYLPFQINPTIRLPMLETLTLENVIPDPPTAPFCLALSEATALKHIQFKGGRTLPALLEQLQPNLSRSQHINTVVLDSFTYDKVMLDIPTLYKVDRIVASNLVMQPGSFGCNYSDTTCYAKTLTIVFDVQVNIHWLKYITARSLRAIEVIHTHQTSFITDGLCAILSGLFIRSEITSSLRRLVLKGVVMWASDVVDILRLTSQVEELVLHEPVQESFADKFVFPNFLTRSDAEDIVDDPHMISESFCMRFVCDNTLGAELRTVELVWSCDMSPDAVLDIVEERKNVAFTIGTQPHNRFAPDDMQRIAGLRREGRVCCLISN